MKYYIYYFQLIVSFLGFLICYFLSGIIGSYAVEYNHTPSEMDKIIFAFHHSSYPYIALLFLVWMVVTCAMIVRKKRSKSFKK